VTLPFVNITHQITRSYIGNKPLPVAGPSKVCISSRWIAGIAGSNPADDMDVRLLCLLCVVQVAASATS